MTAVLHVQSRRKGNLFFRCIQTAFALVCLAVLPNAVYSQAPTHISGTVFDATTKRPLPLVNILVDNTPYGAATDTNGYFEIRNLQPDLYVLEFRHVAYQKRFHVLRLKPSEKVIFDIELYEQIIQLAGVEITASPQTPERLQQSYASNVISAKAIAQSGARKLSDVLRSFEPSLSTSSLTSYGRPGDWTPYMIFLDGAYVQYIPGALDAIIDVVQIEKIEVSRWVGVSPNRGPGTSDRVILITSKKSR